MKKVYPCKRVRLWLSTGRTLTHVVRQSALTSRAWSQHALCGGMKGVTVINTPDLRRYFPKNPLPIEFSRDRVTCHVCRDRLNRIIERGAL